MQHINFSENTYIKLDFINQIQTQFDIRVKITYEKTNIYVSWGYFI